MNDHYAKTAGMFLQPDKEGKQKISNHHWNEVSAILDDTAKYKVFIGLYKSYHVLYNILF